MILFNSKYFLYIFLLSKQCFRSNHRFSLMQVESLALQLVGGQEVVDDGVLGGEGGCVHPHWVQLLLKLGAHHRVVRHVVHLGIDVLLLVAGSAT